MQEQARILGAYDTEVNTGQTSAWSYKYFINKEWMNKMQSQASWYSAQWSVSSLMYMCAASLTLTQDSSAWVVICEGKETLEVQFYKRTTKQVLRWIC